MNRRSWLRRMGILAFTLVATTAHAQDAQWEGWHLGIEFGPAPQTLDVAAVSEQVNSLTDVNVTGRGVISVPPTIVVAPAASLSGTSFVAGAEAGWDRRQGQWVYGGMVDLDLGGASSTTTFAGLMPATLLTPVTSVTTTREVSGGGGLALRARGGYVWKDTLFYGTAGLAALRIKLSATGTWTDPGGAALSDGGIVAMLGPLGPDVTNVPEASHMKAGATFGFGAERMITSVLAAGLEYRHTGVGTTTFSNASASTTYAGTLTGNTVTTGLGNGAIIPGATDVKLTDNRVVVRLSWFPGRR